MNARILIVDDDQDIFVLLGSQLAKDGFDVSWAPNASSFKHQAFQEKPHLIILDIMLGDDCGPEVYRELLAQGLSHHVPVIFLSALVSDSEVSEAHPGSTYSMHSKPLRYDDLVKDIRSLTAA